MAKNYYLLLKTDGFLRHLITYCLLLGGLVAYLTAAPFLIISKLHIAAENFGFTQLPVFGAYVLGAIFLSRATDEECIRKVLFQGLVCIFVGSISLFVTSYIFGNHLVLFIGAMTIYAFGLSLCSSPLINEVMSSAIVSKGSAAAFLGFGMAVSCALSSMLISVIYNGTVLSLATLLVVNVTIAMCCYSYKFVVQRFEYKTE
jgi:Na+/melibiose symporter-like transporter